MRAGAHPLLSGDPDKDLRFDLGGPTWWLMRRIGLAATDGPSVVRRSLAFLAIGWVPLLVLSLASGTAIGPTPRSSLLLDFAAYARLFVAVPLVFAAEILVGPRIRAAGLRIATGGLLPAESMPSFLDAVARVRRRRDAALPELILVLIAVSAPWILTIETATGIGEATETWGRQAGAWLPAGIWYKVVTLPLLQFFSLRWVWRWIIWSLFLAEVSRMRLELMPTHTDMAAGLGFLGLAHVPMAIFPFAISCIVAAELAFRIVFEGLTLAALQSMLPLLLAYLLVMELLVFGPLLVLVPVLAAARREALRSYGVLVQRHNRLFHEKWIAGREAGDQVPLGNPDMSSLVDLGSSYTVIREMNVLPVSRRQMLQVAVIACLPGLPLFFLALPIGEVARLILGVIA